MELIQRQARHLIPWLPAFFLLAVTVLAYIPAIHGGFIWDDDCYAGSSLLARPDALRKIWTLQPAPETDYYREFPMVYATFLLERRLWGLRPVGYHVDNVILHMINAILVWLLLKRLGMRGAWMVGAIFALHPVQVESVAWISERKNVLSGLFFLSALGGYLRFEAGDGRRWYWGSLGLFLLALLSKTVTSTLPVALLLLRWQRGLKIGWREARNLLPFFALAVGWGIFTVWVETNVLGPEAQRSAFHLSFWQHLLLAGRALWFYPMKLAWPVHLAFSYECWKLDAQDWAQWLWPAAALAGCAGIWLARERWGRGLAAAMGFYALTIAPMLGFLSLYTFRFTFVADHYQYLASIGLIVAAVGGAERLVSPDTGSRRGLISRRWLGAALSAAVLSLLGLATWRQGRIYKDSDHIWIDTIEKNPSCWLAHNNLAIAYRSLGRTEDALRQSITALKLKPDSPETHNNLGLALAGQGKSAEAMAEYRQALKINPNDASALNNLGTALFGQGKSAEAIVEYRQALRMAPNFAAAHNNLGLALAREGKLAEAAAEFQQALKINPNDASALNNLGAALAGQGQAGAIIAAYQQALKINPNDAGAHNNLGLALAREGKLAEATAEFQQALKINPNDAGAHNNVGLTLAGQGKVAEAIAEFRRALKINPNCAQAAHNLRSALGGRR